MSLKEDWHTAVADVYRAFSGYDFPANMEAAPKHDVPRIMSALSSTSLAKLSPDCLGPFAASALYTIGSADDYKHFLPRILELSLIDGKWIGFEPEVIAAKLIYANWMDWPANERTAIWRLFDAGWRLSREADPEINPSDSFLCANCRLGSPIDGLVSGWLPLNGPLAALQLALVVDALSQIAEGTIYWEDVEQQQRDQLRTWIESESVWWALTAAAPTVPEDHRWMVEQALNRLRRH